MNNYVKWAPAIIMAGFFSFYIGSIIKESNDFDRNLAKATANYLMDLKKSQRKPVVYAKFDTADIMKRKAIMEKTHVFDPKAQPFLNLTVLNKKLPNKKFCNVFHKTQREEIKCHKGIHIIDNNF